MATEQFRNRESGLVWAANPGTPAYVRMSTSDLFEPVKPEPKPSKRSRSKPADDDGVESGDQ